MASERTVLITGASTGIGRACALRMDALGWRVLAGVRRAEDADALRQAASPRLTPVTLDVTRAEHIAAVLADHPGELHALVNNAGTAVGGPLECADMDRVRQVWEVNVLGLLAVTRACIPRLRASRGRIVNMSSIAGLIAAPGMSTYAGTKFAVRAIGDALRRELAAFGVSVSTVFPGTIETPIWDKGRARGFEDMRAMTDAQRADYAPLLGVLTAFSEAPRAPVELVADAVAHALTHRRPRRHYLVGRERGMRLVTWLPDWFLDGAMRWNLRRHAGFKYEASAAAGQNG